jgi:biotin carboxyl carrier protein
MKKYLVREENSDTNESVEIVGENKASVNGNEINYDFKFINENVLILRINDKNYFLTLSGNDGNNFIEVNLESKTYRLSCKSELEVMSDEISGNKAGDKIKKEIQSPMPGIIKSLNVKEGQKIAKGDILLVLEAMKMENEIKAAGEGIIKKVRVEVMSSVEKNELLIELE